MSHKHFPQSFMRIPHQTCTMMSTYMSPLGGEYFVENWTESMNKKKLINSLLNVKIFYRKKLEAFTKSKFLNSSGNFCP